MTQRRRLVQILMVVNAAGAIVCSALLAEIVIEHRTPWFGIFGVAVMFAGIVIPFHREFTALQRGFQEVERSAMTGIRLRDGARNRADVLSTAPNPDAFRRVRGQPLLALSLTVVGWGLVLTEGVLWLINR